MTKLEKIGLALSKGKIGSAKALLTEYYLNEDKTTWDRDRQAEYDAVYPSHRDMTDDEKDIHDTDEEGNAIKREADYVYPQIRIEYITVGEDGAETRTPEEYLTYDEWLAETTVIEEAELDDEGNVIKPEVTELIRQYTPIASGDLEAMVESYGPLAQAKQAIAVTKYKNQAESMLAGYEQYERDTFNVQEAEAIAYKADNEANVPMITAIAAARGVGVDVLADKILAKSDLFKTAVGTIMGAKQKELG